MTAATACSNELWAGLPMWAMRPAPSTRNADGIVLRPAARSQFVARDRDGGLRYDGSLVYPPEAALWG